MVEAGQVIPSDGEIVEGVASIDESAITGESAPVIREAGGDRSGVTGGTRVLSDQIVIQITAAPGNTFLDRMIALVEGAIRQRTPNEIALTLVLAAFTLDFPDGHGDHLADGPECRAIYVLDERPYHKKSGYGRADACGTAGLFDPHDHRRPFGRHRYCRHGPGAAGEHPRQKRQGGRSRRRRGYTAFGQDRHDYHGKSPCHAVHSHRRLFAHASCLCHCIGLERRMKPRKAKASSLCITSSTTLWGRPVTAGSDGLLVPPNTRFISFSAQSRMSGVDLADGRRIRKGAPDAVIRYVEHERGIIPANLDEQVHSIASKGATPLLVAEGNRIAGLVVLEDVLKPGMKDRFQRLRQMGLRTVMITGDNPLTAAAIAATAGVDDFLAEATPEAKLAYIRKEQAEGKLVAMMGDGTNDAPALAQADVGVAMNSGTQAAKEAGNMVDLDSDPTKLIETVEIGKQLLMTRGALTTFSIANDVAKYFAIIPAMFAGSIERPLLPWLKSVDIMNLHSPESAILSAVIFNAIIILLLIPIALKGVKYRPVGADALLRRNLLIWGLGGVIVPFVGIKLIDMIMVALHLVA